MDYFANRFLVLYKRNCQVSFTFFFWCILPPVDTHPTAVVPITYTNIPFSTTVAARRDGVSKDTREGYSHVQLFVFMLGRFYCVFYLGKLTVQRI